MPLQHQVSEAAATKRGKVCRYLAVEVITHHMVHMCLAEVSHIACGNCTMLHTWGNPFHTTVNPCQSGLIWGGSSGLSDNMN